MSKELENTERTNHFGTQNTNDACVEKSENSEWWAKFETNHINFITVQKFPDEYGDFILKVGRIKIEIKRTVYRVRDGFWRNILKFIFPKTVGFIVLPNYIIMFRY